LPLADVKTGLCRPHAQEVYREYYAANAGVISRRHSARKRKLDPVPEWWRDECFEKFGALCAYGCGQAASALDHVYPVNRGGRSRPENLVPACTSCNSKKRDADPDPWILRGMEAFPLIWNDLIALNYERAGFLEAV
jgi:5-methylcytosine-specific restriction endonuclease McrA